MSARELAEKFFGHVEAGEVDEILGMMTPDATVSLVPLNRRGPMAADSISGRVVAITGGARGIGLAIGRSVARRGARIAPWTST